MATIITSRLQSRSISFYKSPEILFVSQRANGSSLPPRDVSLINSTEHQMLQSVSDFTICLPSIIRVTKACCCAGSEHQKRAGCERLNYSQWAHPKTKKPVWRHCFQEKKAGAALQCWGRAKPEKYRQESKAGSWAREEGLKSEQEESSGVSGMKLMAKTLSLCPLRLGVVENL